MTQSAERAPQVLQDLLRANKSFITQSAERAHQVLQDLLRANKSFVAGDSQPQSALSPPSKRTDLADNGQKPVAAIVACADSRVAPEIVFDCGIGHVFVIRNAGNTAWDDSVVGSLEYAVAHLDVPLVMVLGHTLCGAITAAVGAAKDGASADKVDTVDDPLSKHVYRLAEVVKPDINKPDEVKSGVATNVKSGVKDLREGKSKVAEYATAGKIAIVGAVYDIHTGEVVVIDE